MTEGLVTSMADALAVAEAEIGQASPNVSETGLPPVEEEASDDGKQTSELTGEHPAADENGYSDEAKALADSLVDTTDESQNGSDSGGLTPGSDDFWDHQVEVKTVAGPEMVSVRELTDGYLRQADYTQKTQVLAEQRKHLETANEFYEGFRADPHEWVRSLSVQAGLIEEGAIPVKQVEVAKLPTQEDLDAQVSELVEERVASDERVQAAQITSARADINTEFDRLQDVFGIPISEALRTSLIEEAQAKGNGDLEGLLAKRLVMSQKRSSQVAAIEQATTNRPGVPPKSATSVEGDTGPEFPSLREAFKQAQVAATQQ